MKTKKLNIVQPDNITLSKIVEPLAQALQGLTQHEVEVEHSSVLLFEGPQAAITLLDLHSDDTDQLLRALWTILEVTRFSTRSLNFADLDEPERYGGPLMFAIEQSYYGASELQHYSELSIYTRNESFDVRAAERQISNLVKLVRDPKKLVRHDDATERVLFLAKHFG